jgi:hypothetical protein
LAGQSNWREMESHSVSFNAGQLFRCNKRTNGVTQVLQKPIQLRETLHMQALLLRDRNVAHLPAVRERLAAADPPSNSQPAYDTADAENVLRACRGLIEGPTIEVPRNRMGHRDGVTR